MSVNGTQGPSRRELLAVVAGGSTLMAGCIGEDPEASDDGDTDDTDGDDDAGTDETEIVDRALKYGLAEQPEDVQFNPYNPTNEGAQSNGAVPGGMVFDNYIRYIPDANDYVGRIISDWEIGEEEVTLEINEEYTWHDGADVVADDVFVHLKLYEYVGHSIWDYIEDVEREDETTIKLSVVPVNEEVLLQTLATLRLTTKSEIFVEWLDDLEDADSESEDEILAELLDWRLEAEETVGNGPFHSIDIREGEIEVSRYEDYPWAANINYSTYRQTAYIEDSARDQAFIAGQLDGHRFHPAAPQTQEQYPDELKRINLPDYGGYCLYFNHDGVLEDRNVRQAIAHIIHREDAIIGTNTPGNEPTNVPCGISERGGLLEDIVGDDIDSFESYGVDTNNTEEATALLEEAGYHLEDEEWVDEDGEQLSLDLVGPTWGVMATICEVLTSQLDRSGINVDLSIVEPGVFGERFNTADYELMLRWWGSSAETPHPFFSFNGMFSSDMDRELINYPEEVSVPWPPDDPTGEESINVADLVTEMGQAAPDEANEIAYQLAWAWNQELPSLPLSDRFVVAWQTTDGWDIPEDQEPDTRELVNDDPNVRVLNTNEWWTRQGMLSAEPE